MNAVFTTETRLSEKDCSEIIAYVRAYVHDYGMIQRYVWQYIVHHNGITNKSKLNTELQQRYGIMKRTANSVIYEIAGRYKALVELKKTERYQLKDKIAYLEQNTDRLAVMVNQMKVKASRNQLSEKQLVDYRNKKRKLYYRHQKIQKLKDRRLRLESDLVDKKYGMGFGSKRMFRVQYHLNENDYKTHEKWYHEFVKRRDGTIFYLGSKDETACNQMFQLSILSDGKYAVKIRKDGRYVENGNYITGICSFKYMADVLKSSFVQKDRPVSYRIKIRGRKVYLQAIIQLNKACTKPITNMGKGAIGLDFNFGHMELSETDGKGNLVSIKSYHLRYHGTGDKALNEMRQVVSEIGKYVLSKGKSIVKEDLSFVKKKSKTVSKQRKKYNNMLHTLDYARYEGCLTNMCVRNQIELILVNPAYTSQIAKQKYCNIRKLTVHSGAAYVIARRGQGFKDRLASE